MKTLVQKNSLGRVWADLKELINCLFVEMYLIPTAPCFGNPSDEYPCTHCSALLLFIMSYYLFVCS
jgi:hypothetical protein